MRTLVISVLLFVASFSYGQQADTTVQQVSDTTGRFTFTARFDKRSATKDGYYVGSYVVVLDPKDAERFDGKLVRLTGTSYVVPGLNDTLTQYDSHGDPIILQGRSEDTIHFIVDHIELVPE